MPDSSESCTLRQGLSKVAKNRAYPVPHYSPNGSPNTRCNRLGESSRLVLNIYSRACRTLCKHVELVMVDAGGDVRAVVARTSRWRGRPAPLSASGIPACAVEPSHFCEVRRFSNPPTPPNKKATARVAFLFGGGGGNRTPVRRSYIPGSTCIAHRLVSSCGNTVCEAHRRTSRLRVSR